MEQDVWQEIEQLYQKFQKLGINEAVDYDKYYLYSLITHSTAIEGSTLTEIDTQLLFDEGVTAKGKPLIHHLMNEDLRKAYELAKEEAQRNTLITPVFLQGLNAALMRTTGSVHSVMGGSFDSSKGEYRLCGVTAGVGGRSYMNYLKVPVKVEEFCAILQEKQNTAGTLREREDIESRRKRQLGVLQTAEAGAHTENGHASSLPSMAARSIRAASAAVRRAASSGALS